VTSTVPVSRGATGTVTRAKAPGGSESPPGPGPAGPFKFPGPVCTPAGGGPLLAAASSLPVGPAAAAQAGFKFWLRRGPGQLEGRSATRAGPPAHRHSVCR
jgi:hypothetical protein